MQVVINGKQISLDGVDTVADLVRQLDLKGRIAVEVNRELVSRGSFESRTLREGDVIEVVQAIGGG